MFYVKLDSNGNIEKYPYTLTDLVFDNPNVSFSDKITNEDAAFFNVFPVTPSEQPEETYDINLVRNAKFENGKWVEFWTSSPATEEQKQERIQAKSTQIRNLRNELLKESDWSQLPDVSNTIRNNWLNYRQSLRDITDQSGFPWNVTWPTEP